MKNSSCSRAFILCAGDGTHWANHLGVPKQLIEFSGESLLARSIRLLARHGIEDVVCVSRDPRLSARCERSLVPERSNLLVETILSTCFAWQARTVILLGDVFFTERAMHRICSNREDLAVFGRPWASGLLECRHGELFGMSFDHSAAPKVIAAAQRALEYARSGARGNLWDLYHVMAGLQMNSGQSERAIFRVIDDMTNDFDRPCDYDTRFSLYTAATSQAVFDRCWLALALASRLPKHIVARHRGAVAVGESIPPPIDHGENANRSKQTLS